MMKIHIIDFVALLLVCIGALNWGLVAINPDYNLVTKIVGYMHFLSPDHIAWVVRGVYALVGVAGLYSALLITQLHR